ncbi:MAG: radical SAM family heme chaperone HemW [Candidatus Neptunochlamydia sp.]|nr:radical SAM family heme chaperone HemW [Candidatus Neptunochlamydia sp.]
MVKASLYFHFPFCTRKCPYCHFYVIPNKNHEPFLQALLKEWEMRLLQIENKEILSLYFGGGTPTLFIEGIEAILKRISAPEITVETNPEDVTPQLMEKLYDLSVNRVSIGVQSFNNSLLKHLRRSHTAQKAIDAVEITRNAGIENITIDLMYELPYQTLETWEETVDKACSLPITHLSLYNLTFEPHTVFKKKENELRPHLPDEETAAGMLNSAITRFEKAGLKRYEISAFARNDQISVHNSGYWTGRPFLGYGPSAFSYWEGKRFQNFSHMNKYNKRLAEGTFPIDFEEKLSPLPSLHEKIAIGLRLTKGLSLPNIPLSTQKLLRELDQEGWLTYDTPHVKLTEKGTLFYDKVAEQIILLS